MLLLTAGKEKHQRAPWETPPPFAEGQEMVEGGIRLVFQAAPEGSSGMRFARLPQTHVGCPYSKPTGRLKAEMGCRKHLGIVHAQKDVSPAAFVLALGWEIQRKQKHKHQLWVWEGVQMAETDTSSRNVGSSQAPEILPLSV